MAEYGDLPFDLAIQWFFQKLSIPTRHWDEILGQMRDRAFTVAGAMSADILMDFRNSVDAAIDEGISLGQFQQQFDEIVEKYGWTYTGQRAWRSALIYDTNVRAAYAQGRYQQQFSPQMKKRRPYLQYRLGDVATRHRAEHEKWDRLILPADDPWWDTHYPPNGFGCKCRAFSLSERDLKRMGKSGPDETPKTRYYEFEDRNGKMHKLPVGIDPGWDHNPGKIAMTEDKSKYPKELGRYLK